MKEDKDHIDYFELISRYLSGNASDEEVTLLEQWVLSSEENKSQFNAFRNAWMLSGVERPSQEIDVEGDWQSVSGQLFPKGRVVPLPAKPKRSLGLMVRIAAAVALLIVASVWIYQSINRDSALELITRNEIDDNYLPDGTQLAMNRFSSVKYALDTEGNSRTVELTGDAFFEVERDTAQPFVILAQDVKIEVLGTAFYVDARDDQPQVQVIVRSGLVGVTAQAQNIVLTPDEIGIYDKTTGELTKKQNEDINYMAWKTDVLRFENTELERVVFDLNRKFHANISIRNDEIKSCQISTTFENRSLDTIIKIIEETLRGIKSEKIGEEIVLSGSSCDK
jgi:transmembrane sensor